MQVFISLVFPRDRVKAGVCDMWRGSKITSLSPELKSMIPHMCAHQYLSLAPPPYLYHVTKTSWLSSWAFSLFCLLLDPVTFYLVKEKGEQVQILISAYTFIKVGGINSIFPSKDENVTYSHTR